MYIQKLLFEKFPFKNFVVIQLHINILLTCLLLSLYIIQVSISYRRRPGIDHLINHISIPSNFSNDEAR